MVKDGWKNVKGTSEYSPEGCNTWEEYWEKKSGKQWPQKCSVVGCNNPPKVGAHICNPNVGGAFIAPLCEECNKRNDVFRLKDDVEPVLVVYDYLTS
jgi:hypothetical protein